VTTLRFDYIWLLFFKFIFRRLKTNKRRKWLQWRTRESILQITARPHFPLCSCTATEYGQPLKQEGCFSVVLSDGKNASPDLLCQFCDLLSADSMSLLSHYYYHYLLSFMIKAKFSHIHILDTTFGPEPIAGADPSPGTNSRSPKSVCVPASGLRYNLPYRLVSSLNGARKLRKGTWWKLAGAKD